MQLKMASAIRVERGVIFLQFVLEMQKYSHHCFTSHYPACKNTSDVKFPQANRHLYCQKKTHSMIDTGAEVSILLESKVPLSHIKKIFQTSITFQPYGSEIITSKGHIILDATCEPLLLEQHGFLLLNKIYKVTLAT